MTNLFLFASAEEEEEEMMEDDPKEEEEEEVEEGPREEAPPISALERGPRVPKGPPPEAMETDGALPLMRSVLYPGFPIAPSDEE